MRRRPITKWFSVVLKSFISYLLPPYEAPVVRFCLASARDHKAELPHFCWQNLGVWALIGLFDVKVACSLHDHAPEVSIAQRIEVARELVAWNCEKQRIYSPCYSQYSVRLWSLLLIFQIASCDNQNVTIA